MQKIVLCILGLILMSWAWTITPLGSAPAKGHAALSSAASAAATSCSG